MPETVESVTPEMIASAVKNEWGKTFTLGDRTFEIKDLPYFDYLEFITLAKPLIVTAMSGVDMVNKNGQIDIEFNPGALDIDAIIKLAGKELPKLGQLVCKQTDKNIKAEEVAILARRPQRLVEIVFLQIMHNKMIEEFGDFFQRLAGLTTAMMPDVAKVASPSDIKVESPSEETPSSS